MIRFLALALLSVALCGAQQLKIVVAGQNPENDRKLADRLRQGQARARDI